MNKRNFEWATIEYERSQYDVCVSMHGDEVDEIKPVDSEIDITPVMDLGVIKWMYEQAREEIDQRLAEPPCRSMNAKTRIIEGV